MRTRVNLNTDPITLTVMAADGAEHTALEAVNNEIIEVALIIKAKPDEREFGNK